MDEPLATFFTDIVVRHSGPANIRHGPGGIGLYHQFSRARIPHINLDRRRKHQVVILERQYDALINAVLGHNIVSAQFDRIRHVRILVRERASLRENALVVL